MSNFTQDLYLVLHYSAKNDAVVELDADTSNLIVGGGILVELLLAGRLLLDERSLAVTDTGDTGDEMLDEALAALAPQQPRNPDDPEWIKPIIQKLPSGGRLLAQLLALSILHREEKRGLFGLSRSVVYVPDPTVVQQLVDRRLSVMLHGARPDPHTAALLFMAGAWGHEDMVKLSGKEKRRWQKRWEALFEDYWGWYPVDREMEPVEGLDPATRKAIGDIALSWISIQAASIPYN